jgi:cardiolipin synthase A/B
VRLPERDDGGMRRRDWAVPAAAAAAGVAWYASDTLRHRREGGRGYDLRGEVDPCDPEFVRVAGELTGAPVSEGNNAELLVNGDQIFPVFLATIRGAQSTVNLLTYVYWRGEIADQVAEALCERARAGVEVNVLLDALGAVKMDGELIEEMEEAGVCVRRFRPPRPYAMRRLTNRNHRKILVADGQVGMIGGVGIAEEWTGNAEDPDHWRDTHLRVLGPVVAGLQGAFAENWLEATGDVLVGVGYLPELPPVRAGGGLMQVVRSSAGVGDSNVEALYYMAIASARRSIDLTAAYFAPRPAFVEALVRAAQRGVDVRILVPGPHIDKNFVRIAGRGVYARLMQCGVRIWEYQPTMLHAKTMVVDGMWSSVGSVNFDNRSFQLHDEATLCVHGEELAGLLRRQLEDDLRVSEEIDPARWNDRGARQRAAEAVMTLARREL